MPDQTETAVRHVAAQLEAKGHGTHAARLHAVLNEAGSNLLLGVRETCQTILTAIEAIDPVSASMVDELRLEVDKRLGPAEP
jgi:hypothetical protein